MDISNKKIDKAGQRLINKKSSISKADAALVLQQFRLIHKHPMSLFRHMIERKLKKHDIEAIPVQRLKRVPSIVKKLEIQKNMKLSRMQDIGGLRIVLEDIREVNLIRDEIKKVENHKSFKFTCIDEDNYIKNPHPSGSGYRSIHMIYKYDKKVEKREQCKIELQIRTKLQHSWATAVEVVGTYLNQPLKQSFGKQEYLDVFKNVSKIFSDLEENIADYKFIEKIQQEIEDVKLLNILQNFKIVTKHFDNNKNIKGQYVLLKMNFREKIVEIAQYSNARFEQANEDYIKMELEYLGNSKIEVVLLSIQDIKKLNQSYPNYFMDTTEFISNLNRLFNIVKIKQTNSYLKDEKLREISETTFKDILEKMTKKGRK